MNFNTLDDSTKLALHKELLEYANKVGGVNFFLQMIESIKEQKVNPLTNESAKFHYPKGIIEWKKSIYKNTLTALFNAMKKEDKEGDMLDGLSPKRYKETMNMMKALKPVQITVNPVDVDDAVGFSFFILDTTQEKKTKVSFIFKILFFYSVNFSKQVLTYKVGA